MRILTGMSALGATAYLFSACLARAEQIDIQGPQGSTAFGSAVMVLANGNFVVVDPAFSEGGNTNVGAVYLFASDGSLISTLTGASANDRVGSGGIVQLKGNVNFVVGSPNWNNYAGAVTWVNGSNGLNGAVSATNSLIGTTSGDSIGAYGQIAILDNGNCVVAADRWTDPTTGGMGAATWIDGSKGLAGPITSANSLLTGGVSSPSVQLAVLANGNYAVGVPFWRNGAIENAGAVVWENGSIGAKGYVSKSNALYGTTVGDEIGFRITALRNGHYVVTSPFWSNGSVSGAGAATWGNGTSGVVGPVGSANSLVGTNTNDYVGFGGVTALSNGSYVVSSQYWHSDPETRVGAATWVNGNGTLKGPLSTANSLVGSQDLDEVGVSVIALNNGNYVVSSYYWNNGAQTQAGAVTWGSGASGTHGTVSAANSLVGTQTTDEVGTYVTALTDGNYVVMSPDWNHNSATYLGAVTWASGAQPTAATVSVANSLLGATAYDYIGYSAHALAGGAYVITSPYWGDVPGYRGAVTWQAGGSLLSGNIDLGNSLTAASIGSAGYDVQVLNSGGYVAFSAFWSDGLSHAGAITWCRNTAPCKGLVTPMNSFIGFEDINDGTSVYTSVVPLPDGNYMIKSAHAPNGTLSLAGAITLASGNYRLVGSIAPWNSVQGGAANGGSLMQADYDQTRKRLVVGRPAENIVSLFTMDQVFAANFEP